MKSKSCKGAQYEYPGLYDYSSDWALGYWVEHLVFDTNAILNIYLQKGGKIKPASCLRGIFFGMCGNLG